MGFFSTPPQRLQVDISQGMSHNMTWNRVFIDWVGKLDEIHITDTSIRVLYPKYGLDTELKTASVDDTKKFIMLIDRELLSELPSQEAAIPRIEINELSSLLKKLGHTPDALIEVKQQHIIESASELTARERAS